MSILKNTTSIQMESNSYCLREDKSSPEFIEQHIGASSRRSCSRENESEHDLDNGKQVVLSTQKQLLLTNLKSFFTDNKSLTRMMNIIQGESRLSLRIIDWFVTNYAKMYFMVYELPDGTRFKVHNEYKLKLKAYQKKNFDPFCRWERIRIPYDDHNELETTIGQLNFFKWSFENGVIDYIENHYEEIEADMNSRNSIAKKKSLTNYEVSASVSNNLTGTRKKREELSISACKCIKKENVKIIIKFN